MADSLIDQALRVNSLEVDKLLADWRWLCTGQLSLVARNAFGDLFLANASGEVLWLEIAAGRLTRIASSRSQFFKLLERMENLEAWLAESDAKAASGRGLQPGLTQCIGFRIPLAFAESRELPDNAYIADLYEHVSFLGDMHRQIASIPEGGKIRLRIQK
jgi:hypothetical protein